MPSAKKPGALAETVREAERTEETIAARCRHFGACGGCDLQRLPYPAQLRLKRRLVEAAITALPQTAACAVLDAAPASDEWCYRNKVEMTFDRRDDGGLALGYSPKTKWWQRIDVEECWLCPERMLGAAFAVKAWAAQAALAPYDPRRHEGFLRYLVMRESPMTGDFVVNLVTADGSLPDPSLVDAVREFRPTGVLRTVHSGPAAAVKFERVEVLAGEPSIRESVAGLSFILSPESFFQTNTAMASRLLEVVAEAALSEAAGPGQSPAPTTDLRVLDMFCGVGTIGLSLAARAREVVGVESVEAAVISARENAAANGITNARFVCANAREYLRDHGDDWYDVVVVDPPRPGCGPRVIKRLLEVRPPRIVYVSCNPRALAVELAALSALYDIGPLQPLDMFPQTAHVECVAGLTLR